MAAQELKTYILPDKDKFYNWVYPTYEECAYKKEKHPNEEYTDFYLSQGQKFVKDFLVNSPYRGILLYHGLGTGKTCAALITAQELIDKHHVLLFIPASLKQNWLNELEYCGSKVYKNKEEIYKNYTFVNYNSSGINDVYSENGIINNLYLGSEVEYEKNYEKNIGIIIEIKDGNFNEKNYNPDRIVVKNKETDEIVELNLLEYSVKLVNNVNPFDNKIIIFDEVHNFIVTISNIIKKFTKLSNLQKVKVRVYEDLKSAVNCKIILLSGTPIVNNCYEVSYISNILNGRNLLYKFEYIIHSNFNLNLMNKVRNKINDDLDYINYVDLEYDNNRLFIHITLNPSSFYKLNLIEIQEKDSLTNNINEKLKKFEEDIDIIFKVEMIKSTFLKMITSELSSTYMPENYEDFIKKFLISEYNSDYNINYYTKIKNINVINSLLAGKISYIKGEIPTKSIESTIHLPMGLEQESRYITIRKGEIEASKKQMKSSDPDDINLSSLRSKSRQVCNIYIPKEDINLDESFDTSDDSFDEEIVVKKNEGDLLIDKFISNEFNIKEIDLDSKFQEIISKLEDNDYNIEEKIIKIDELKSEKRRLVLEKINKYSNKFSYIIDKIIKTTNSSIREKNYYFPEGKVLVYSDFRESISGGVNFIGKLLNIPDLGFISLFDILNKSVLDSIFVSNDEKKQYKETYFNNELKQKLVNKFIEILDTKQEYRNFVYHLWKSSDNKSNKENYIAHIIYDSDENKNGSLLRTLFITRSGSEGISLKAVRQIHIIEPFWQETRKKQVIGRGIRFKSHDQLELEHHSVYVFEYLSTFSKNMNDSILGNDNNLTTDQYILSVSKKKQSIINTFYNILKSVSLDCPYNNEIIDCFSFNNLAYYNLNEKPIYLYNAESLNITKHTVSAKLIKYDNKNYIIHNNIIYDYEKYTLHKILIKIGKVIYDEANNIILDIERDHASNQEHFPKSKISLEIKKDILDTEYYGDISNKHTLVSFITTGGSNDIELQERMDSNEDFVYDYDNDEDYDEDDEDYEEFNDNNDLVTNLYRNNEIEVNYTNIKLHNDEIDLIFKINDFIGLYDELTNEKILIGQIKKITNLYILVNDITIPIINNNENTAQESNFILYKVKSKNKFIDELGNDLLQLYIASEYVTKIYEKYRKNDIFDNLITNINSKIKLYHTQNFNMPVDSSQSINKTIIDDMISMISESESLSDDSLLLTESTLLDTLNTQRLDDIYIKSDSDDFILIKEKYIQVINDYYLYYIDFLSNLKKSQFTSNNNTFIRINNIILDLIKNKDLSNLKIVLQLIKVVLFIETSLIDFDDDKTNQTKINDINQFLEIFKEEQANLKVSKLIQSLLNNKKTKQLLKSIPNPFLTRYIKEINYRKSQLIDSDDSDSDSDSDADSESVSSPNSNSSNGIQEEINNFNSFIDNIVLNQSKKYQIYESQVKIIKNIFVINEVLLSNGYNIIQFTKLLLNSDSDIFTIIIDNEKKLSDKIKELSDDDTFIKEKVEPYLVNIEKNKKKNKSTLESKTN